LSSFSDSPNDWDTYYTLIDDCPASIALNIDLAQSAPLSGLDRLLAVLVFMNEPGEHGMGDGKDPEILRHVEEQIVRAYEDKLGATFVGRIRGQGAWQLYFYGPDTDSLAPKAAELLSGFSGWEQEVHTRSDSDWSTYFELLFPDRERLQWIQDRRVVEALVRSGDPLVVPRRVDHFAYFSSAEDRKRFVSDVQSEGYEVAELGYDSDEELGFSVQFFRSETVELEMIHDAVMKLVMTAEEFSGLYDGWETTVMNSQPKRGSLPN
jgi:uncharacterized protein (TIGR01619 family)